MRRAQIPLLLGTLLLAHAAAARAEWIVDTEGSLVWEDNLTRAAREADRRSGIALAPAVTVGQYLQLADPLTLQVVGDVRGSVYPDFEGLSHVEPTVTVALRHKFGLGPLAPWARPFATAGARIHGDDVRDGVLLAAGLEAGKRLSERIAVQGGYRYESVDARDDVFNSDAHTLSVRGTVGLTPALELTVGYGLRWGDLVIHRSPPSGPPHTRLVDTFDEPLVASRIDATTHLFSAALSYTLTPQSALTVGYEHHISIGPIFDYPNNLVRASVGFTF